MSKKILFFLESLYSGGKERRAIELFHYLKQNTDFELKIVLTEKEIHYSYFMDLEIPTIILKRGLKYDLSIFYKFFKIVKEFKPDIIHAWGGMTTLYAIPSSKCFNIPIINTQVANAVPIETRSLFIKFLWKINHYFSTFILSNSKAGLKAYKVDPKKSRVIYNGIRLERFEKLDDTKFIKEQFNIKTPLCVIMVASFNDYKDFNTYFEAAKIVLKNRNDVTFIAVGDGKNKRLLEERSKTDKIEHFLFTGRILNVENLVNTCDIGVLLSNIITGEGISNTIMEYMALSKPVIATNAGGTPELVKNNISGFLVDNKTNNIVEKIIYLLDNPKIKIQMGSSGREIIESRFTIDKMGNEFVKQYENVISK